MGGSESKEEVVIAQAGNSGGVSATEEKAHSYTMMEIVGIVAICLFIAGFMMYIWKRVERALQKKIRREIVRTQSQELV